MRLQKMRSSGGRSSTSNISGLSSSNSLTDDDKIRLQLYLDVEYFGKQMNKCGVEVENVEKYQQLLVMVEEAKEKRPVDS